MQTPTLADGIAILALAADVISGRLTNPVDISRRLAGIALNLLPVDELKQHLDDEARARVDLVADGVEAAKFGG